MMRFTKRHKREYKIQVRLYTVSQFTVHKTVHKNLINMLKMANMDTIDLFITS
jgi:hypothetical protein